MEILEIEGFKIYGLKTRTKNADEINGDGKIPTLWAKFTKEFYDGKSEIYGVYCSYENGVSGLYDLFIGTKSLCCGSEILEIKSGKYAVFSFPCEPHNVAKFWGEIWKYFESSKLKRAYETDFELYGSDEIKIYISVLD
ncbi:effector binding domain-containing protein [uncultured Campylobacter sp.]|uniref:GyrI-like domain-containing protein n=1 Tax=uncultured Campylobacter sp. TaxID=218934 RepID=UPI00262D8679|nr:effector binding domain-containing protein [uncultured Campylobacter sp.]